MTQEDKKLLIKDICARLPYGLYIQPKTSLILFELRYIKLDPIPDIKPYLRPMSSMTEEEKKEVHYFVESHKYGNCSRSGAISDYLNSIHIDYRGLIEKGLALEAPEGMYKIE